MGSPPAVSGVPSAIQPERSRISSLVNLFDVFSGGGIEGATAETKKIVPIEFLTDLGSVKSMRPFSFPGLWQLTHLASKKRSLISSQPTFETAFALLSLS